jgi:glycosyltransferase involved in cell wall biosynthesis
VKDLLTVIIPCKNEGENIKNLLGLLNEQTDSDGLKVYISDISDDGVTLDYILSETGKKIEIEVLKGGFPSYGRKIGADKSVTPYLLFLDSDMSFMDNNFVKNILDEIIEKDGDLLTCKVRTTTGEFDNLYKVFDVIQKFHRITGPFALGGIMLFNKTTYDDVGGFNGDDIFAEDYNLSKKINSKGFILSKQTILTLPRRFKNKGVYYVIKMMIISFINRNNPNFYKKHHNYWL